MNIKIAALTHEFAAIPKRGHLTVVKTKDKVTGKTIEKEVFVEADLAPHPRGRVGKTAKEWKRDPNKEEHRIAKLRAKSEAHKELKPKKGGK